MSDDANGLASGEPAEVTLDSIIDGAIDKAEAGSADPPAESAAETAQRARDEKGRFAPKDSAAEASKEPAQAATAEVQPPAVDPANVQPIEPPARWTAEEKAKFAAWPRDVQEAVAERNKAIEADYTRKTQEAAEIRRTAEPLLNAIKPFENYLSQLGPVTGQQPPQLIAGLLGMEYRLRTGSLQEKVTALASIAGQYGIDLAALARGEIREPDPAISNMRQELSDLRQWRQQFEQQTQLQQAEQTSLHIESFTNAKDEAGRPRYPHFERVRGVMAQALMNGEARTLEEAYLKAVEPIQAAIAEELKVRQTQADTQRKEALAKAEKAAPVRSSGSQPGGSAKGKGLDSILDDAMTRHNFG
jgi:hypothetical protein